VLVLGVAPQLLAQQGKAGSRVESKNLTTPERLKRLEGDVAELQSGRTQFEADLATRLKQQGDLLKALIEKRSDETRAAATQQDRELAATLATQLQEEATRQRAAATVLSQVQGTDRRRLVPVGTVVAYAGEEPPPPEGDEVWRLCNGDALKRSDYPELFRVIKTAHGAPDDASFNLPDLRGLFLRGVDGSAGRDPEATARMAALPGGNAGNRVGSYQADMFRSHIHAHGSSEHSGAQVASPRSMLSGGNLNHTVGEFAIKEAGGSETRPKNLSVHYLIRVR
jgi:microcystin-dependent protein